MKKIVSYVTIIALLLLTLSTTAFAANINVTNKIVILTEKQINDKVAEIK